MATSDQERTLPEQWVDERGVTLTRAGVEAARDRLAALDAQTSPEDRAARRREVLAELDAA